MTRRQGLGFGQDQVHVVRERINNPNLSRIGQTIGSDVNLIVARRQEVDLRDLRDGQQIIANPFGNLS